ncbi:MAG: RagB/SusD family nutrient uptake outer membrane protein [Bacteroidales bacterium]|nr:RagB/SusD family nutrient uptake outer membrane protein [Bacteroidales bacterium]MCF8390440.1 RagB/SusD family nutrient uptake outer membrane protein [Bacteroidales bacterium]
MKKDIYLIAIIVFGLFTSSCEKLLEPAFDNSISDEMLWSNPIYAEGVLLSAYRELPTLYNFTSDMASGDAISNLKGDNANRLSDGEWSSQFNPLSEWSDAYSGIYYINTFLENMDKVQWSYTNETTSQLHAKRLRGEAYGLRAWFQFQLLQGFSGLANGDLLAFPIVTSVMDVEDFRIPRGSFQACVDTIFADCDRAIALLPTIHENTGDSEVDNAMGVKFNNRINGLAVLALKSRTALYAASPAYNPSNDVSKWELALNITGDLIDSLGGLGNLSSKGTDFYNRNSPSTQEKESELIWYSVLAGSSSMEADNFPPSIFGKGRLNPTQEFVDIFPASDGYPIDLSLVYDPEKPYVNRDKRLASYVVYNESQFKKSTIVTNTADPINGINAQETSTRTGYYLRKFMNESVLLDPVSNNDHFYTYIRATEIFLNFAEAANEFGGPGYNVVSGISALDVMHALRERAGITNHSYIDGLNQADLQEAIQNERRIELCFEGHRFWDIRRWNLVEEMNQEVSGVYIQGDSVFNVQKLGQLKYGPHMIYGPVPFDEYLKMGIKQNDGW